MPANDGSLRFDTDINQDGFNRGVKGITKSIKSLGILLAGVFAVDKLIDFGREAVNLASDLGEVQNVVDTIFGDLSSQIDDFSKTALEKFGLSELSAKRYASSIGAIIRPSGLAADKIAEISTTLTGAIGGLSSFFNRGSDLIEQDLLSFFSGSAETLAKYGVNANITALESFALSKGIDATFNSLKESEKQLLRYEFLVEQLGYTFNDFEKTQDSYANQVRVLTERWKEFLTLIGQELIQVLTPAIKLLNNLLETLTDTTRQFISFYSAVTGQQIEQTSSISEAIDNSTQNQKELGSEVDKTNEKLKGTLASFDEVNVLQEKSKEGGSIADALGGDVNQEVKIDADTVKETAELSPILQSFLDVLKPLGEIDLTNLTNSFSKLGKSLLNISEPVVDILLTLYNDFLVPLTTLLIEDIWPEYIDLLANTIDILAETLRFFNPLAKILLNEILTPLAKFNVDVASESLSLLNDALELIIETIRTNQEETKNTPLIWNEAFAKITPIVTRLGRLIKNVFRTIGNVFTSIYENVILPVLLPAFEQIGETFAIVFPQLAEDFVNIFGTIGGAVLKFYEDILIPFWNYVAEEILPLVKPVFVELGNIFNDYVTGAIVDITKLVGFLSGLITFISGVFTDDWGKAWTGVSEIFEIIFSSLVNFVRVPLNFIIRAINKVLDEISKIKVVIPPIPLLGIEGQTISFGKLGRINEIPAFSQGVAIPVSAQAPTTQQTISQEELTESINKGVQEAFAQQNINIEFSGSMSQLGKILQPLVAKETNRQGKKLSGGTIVSGGVI